MRHRIVAFLLLAALLAGCGSTHHAAQIRECSEAQRQEHPLACERQDEKADPGLAHTKLATEAIQRVQEGRTPQVNGEDIEERDKRAEEEIEAERASG
jgi:uncharacterized membrane-anchored protein